MKFKVIIKMKKPYTAVYIKKPDADLAIEGFADSLKNENIDDLLEVKIVELKSN